MPLVRTGLALAAVAGMLVGGVRAPSVPARRATPPPPALDLVILHGRIMDPESGLDGLRDVGVRGGHVARIGRGGLAGRDTIDASGLVVAPGFIDLHQHAQDPAAYRVEVADGTTTALELESGTGDVAGWYAARAGRALINYGVSAGHVPVRMAVMHDPGPSVPTGPARMRAATPQELTAIVAGLSRGLQEGAVGVGMIVAFTPGARPWEVLEAFRVAARYGASVHVHIRNVEEPEYFLDTEEVLGAAAATGAAAQIVHIQSSNLEDTPKALDLVRGARARGLDITTECYPYTSSMVEIQASGEDWQKRPDSWFARLEWPATGERLTRETFGKYRALGGDVVVHNNTEEVVQGAVADSLTMIASDGILENGIGHPRVAGTFARVLGVYVRERHALGLMEALRKMTIMPARRLEKRVPAMRERGRVREGAAADLVVFDPASVLDRATYRQPILPPVGIPYVVVNGTIVVRRGQVIEDVAPGLPIRAPLDAHRDPTPRP